VALAREEVPTADVLQIDSRAFVKAARWLEEWDGVLPAIGVPTAEPSFDVESRSSGGDSEQGTGGLTGEQRYLMGLLMRQPHEGAACAASSCFCQQHPSLFEEARPPSERG
jgi:hypothetical protein